METRIKRFLSLALAVIMVFGMLPIDTAFASENTGDTTGTPEAVTTSESVAKVGNTEYATIDEAIAAWTNGTTLTLLADVTLSDVIQLSSTEHHILDLGTYTMTAASKKDAIQIVNNGRSSASYALDIKADANNPGGITASGKAVVKTTGKSGVKDRPIIRFYNGVFTGTNVVYHSGSNGTNCPQFWFYGGEFNGTVNANRALFQFYGGTFNGALNISVDSSAYALVSGGRFKKLSNQYGSALNSDKFTIGSAKGSYDRSVYVDKEGYYVITSEIIEGVSAKYPAVVKDTYNSNNYFYYSLAQTDGIFYEDASMASGKNIEVYVKPAVTIPETVTGTIVEEIKNNTALKDYVPENVPTGAELEIELVSAGDTIVYEVTPMENGTKVDVTEAITFRLPVPASVTETHANVYHDGVLMGIYAIQGEGNAKYVEVSSADFSEFKVEPKSYVAAIGTQGYASLQEAIDAAVNGDTVKLLADVALTNTLIVLQEKTLTIDGNGHKVTPAQGFDDGNHNAVLVLAANDVAYKASSNYTVKNLTFEGFSGATRVLRANFSNAVIKNCVFNNNSVSEGVITSAYANLTVENCAFNGNTSAFAILNVGSDVSSATDLVANVTGSSFDANQAAIAVAYLASSANVTGNEFKNNVHTGTNHNGAAILAGPYVKNASFTINITKNAFVNAMGDKPAVFVEDWKTEYNTTTAFDLSTNYWNGAKPIEGEAYKTSGATPNVKVENYHTIYENGTLDGIKVNMAPTNVGHGTLRNDNGGTYIHLNIGTAYAEESLVLKLYDANKNLMSTTEMVNAQYLKYQGKLTANIEITRESSTWETTWEAGYPDPAVLPARIEVYADGILAYTTSVNITADEWAKADGVMKVVAMIGTQGYDSLQAAIDAAANGDTVVVVSDIEATVLPTADAVNRNNNSAFAVVAKEKTVTIDLNGKTISVIGSADAKYDTIGILNYGDLTIEDTVGGGKLTFAFHGTQEVGSSQIHSTILNFGTLTINGGVIENKSTKGYGRYTVNNYSWGGSANVTVNGGTISNDTTVALYSDGYCDNGINNCNVTINGGTFDGGVWYNGRTTAGEKKIIVSGGTFNAGNNGAFNIRNTPDVAEISGGTFNGAVSITEGVKAISGGTFTTDVSSNLASGYIMGENGSVVVDPAYGKVAQIGGVYYETLQAALAAVQEGETVQLIAGVTINEGTVKLPATLKNVTIKGAEGAVLKDTSISAADGNSYSYVGLTFYGLTFDNGRIILTGWRNGEETIENLTITKCVFKNLNDNTNSAPVHINKDASEAVNGFTFTNNVIDGAIGGSKSGVYLQATGEVVFTNNVINNVSFRPYVVQLTSDDGIADEFIVTGNTFSGSAVGRAQGLSNNAAGTDTVKLVVSGNIFKDITETQQICYWNFNPATTTADLSENYYDIDITANPSKIYFNSAATDIADLVDKGVYPFYTELNTDGTIKAESAVQAPDFVAQIGTKKYTSLQAAIDAVQNGQTITLLANVTENVTLTEAVGLYYTIDGDGKTMNGTITVNALSDTDDNRRITIQNINFVNTADTGVDFITANQTNHYPRLTIQDCSFTGNGKDTDVAVRTKSAYDLIIKDCTGTGLHSFLQNTAGVNVTVQNVTVTNSKGGLAMGTAQNVEISGCEITSRTYGIRLDADTYNNNAVIEGNDVTAFIPVVVRKANATSNITVKADNTFTATNTDNLWMAIGTSEYEANGTMPTAATGKVIVTADSYTGIYGNYAEASVNGKEYGSLQAAFGAAQVGDTVVLLQDVVLTDYLLIASDKVVTLELNGKTVSQTKAQTEAYQMILNDGSLTIQDSVGGGKISYTDSGNGGEYISDTIYNRGTLVINGGTIENLSSATVATNGYPHAVDTYSGIADTSVTVNDGVIYCANYSAIRMFCVSATNKADLVINGGTIKGAVDMQNGTKTAALGSLTINGGTFEKNASRANVRFANWNGGATEYGLTGSITGGTFDSSINTGYVPAAANWDSKIVSGGTFGDSSIYSYLADGFEPNVYLEGTQVIYGVKAEILATVDGEDYSSLQAAVDAAAATGEPVFLKKNVVLRDTLVITGDVVLNLKGYTISQSKACTGSYSMIENKGNLTITGNGKISFTDTSAGDPTFGWGSYTITNTGNLVVENGTIEHLGAQNAPGNVVHMICAIQQYSGTLTVKGGTISTPTYRSVRINGGTMNVTGGVFEGQVWVQPNADGIVLNIAGGNFAPSPGDASSVFITNDAKSVELAVTAGTFNGKIGASVPANLKGSVSGNVFFNEAAKNGTSSDLLATDLVFADEAVGGYYTLVDDPYYISDLAELKAFRDAVNAGNTFAGKTITLGDDIDLTGEEWTPIGTSGNIFKGTFDGNGKTISNLVVNGGSSSNMGFFGVTHDGEIKNLTIHNAMVSGRLNVAVVAGTPYTSKYTDIKVTGHVEVNGMAYVGGVGGKDAYANWTNVTVDVDATSYVQAVSTENGNNYRTYVGGVIGFLGEGGHTFKNISSNIKVIGNVCDIGGLFGIAHYGNNFEDVTFTGSVEAPEGAFEVGGIAGVWHNEKGYTVTFDDVTSTGTVTVGDVTTTGSVVGGAYNANNETAENSGSLKIDGKEAWICVAKIGNERYGTIADAIAAANAGDVINLLTDVEATEVILIDKSLTINGNGHKVTSSATRVFRVTAPNVEVTLNDVNMVSTAVRVGTNDIRGIAVDPSLSNVKLTLNKCSVDFTDASASDWSYAVNVAGNGTGHTVTVNGGSYEGANVINVYGANNTIVVKDATLTSMYPNNDMYYGACIWVLQNQGSSVEATGNTFNGANTVVFNLGTGTALTESNNTDNTTLCVAKIGATYYTSLQAAFAAAQDGDTIKVLQKAELTESVKVTKNVTLDLNGKTITGTDNMTSSFGLINNTGTLTIVDSSNAKTGKITLTATNNRGWSAYSSVISNQPGGKLIVESGTIEHLGGTDMAYGIDNLTNGKGTYAEVVVNGGTVKSTYRAIRQFLNGIEAQNILTVNGGTIEGANKSIWMQSPSANANTGSVTVDAAANLKGDVLLSGTAGATTWPVNVSIAAAALKDDSTVFTSNIPVGYEVPLIDGIYGVKSGVAKIDTQYFDTLAAAVAAAKDGDFVTLIDNVVMDATLVVNKSITINGNGYSISPADPSKTYDSAIMAGDSGWGDDHGEKIDLVSLNISGWKTKYGVVRAQGVTLGMYACEMNNNSVSNEAYGVLSLNFTDAEICGVTFKNNTSRAIDINYNGDGSNAVVTIDGCTFEGNTANAAGIVVRNDGEKLVVTNSTFKGNTVTTTGNAAVLYAGWGTNDEVTGNTFKDNTVTTSHATTKRFASAIFCDGCTVNGNVFSGNTATRNGENITTQVAVGAYYGAADIGENFWGGNAPVPGVDYTIEYSRNAVAVEDYYTDADKTDLQPINYVAKVGNYSYTSINAAINAANDGDTVQLLAGRFDEVVAPWAADTDHDTEKSITIVGAENFGTVLTGGLYLGYDDNGSRNHTITIKGIAFEGKGILVAGQQNVVIEGNKFTNITACVADSRSASENAISVIGRNVNATVKGNIIDTTASGGIHLRDVKNATVIGNTVANTQDNSITINPTSGSNGNIVVEDNTLSNWGLGGEGRAMRISGGADVTVNGNVMTNANAPEQFVKITGATAIDASENYWNGVSPITEGIFLAEIDEDPAAILANYYADAAKTQLVDIPASEAKIGNKYYVTVAEALAAAQDGDTVTLFAPIVVNAGETLNLDKAITITYTSNVPGEDMITNRGTLNIGGNVKITYVNTDATASNVTVSTISCEPGSVLNITGGTVENKTVKADGSTIYSYAIDLLTNGNLGDVTANISGGTVSSDYMAIRQFNNGTACKNTLNVTGGYIYGAKRAIQIHMDNSAAYTTITGGKIEGGNYALCFLTKSENVSVSGGEFIGDLWYSGTTGIITGGTYTDLSAETYLADGYTLNVQNGKYVVAEIPAEPVASVAGVTYISLQEAFDAAAAQNEIVYLLKDVTVSETISVKGDVILNLNGKKLNAGWVTGSTTNHIYAIQVETDSTLIIRDGANGNGQINTRGIFNYGSLILVSGTINAIDGNGGYGVRNYPGATFNMYGGTIATTLEDDHKVNEGGYDATPIRVDEGATATISGGVISNISDFTFAVDNHGTTTITGGKFTSGHTVIANDGTMTVEGGEFICNGVDGQTQHAVWAADGTTTITGGTFDGKDTYNGFNVDASAGATVYITGGNFLAVHSGSLYGEGTIKVSGGTFFDAVPAARCAEGFEPKDNGDGTHTVAVVEKVPYGEIAYRAYLENSAERKAVKVDLLSVYAKESVVVVLLDANGNKLTTTSLKAGACDTGVGNYITTNIVLSGKASSSWNTEIHTELTTLNQPAKIELYIDGVLMDTLENALGEYAAEYPNLDCIAKPVAEVNGVKYMDLDAAVKATNAGDTLKLLVDLVDEVDLLTINKPMIIDPNGKNFDRNIHVSLRNYKNDEGKYVQLMCVELSNGLWEVKPLVMTSTEIGEAKAYIDLNDNGTQDAGEDVVSLQAALDAATADQIVRLTGDLTVNSAVIIPEGITLDVQTYTLTVKNLIGLNGSKLTGTPDSKSTDNKFDGGKLVVNPNNLVLSEEPYVDSKNYCVIPVYNADHFVFSRMEVNTDQAKDPNRGLVINEEEKSIYFQFVTNMTGFVKNDLLIDGADDNELTVVIRLEWTTDTGVAYQDFVYSNAFVAAICAGGKDFTFTMTGYDALGINLNTLVVKGMVITESGVEVSGVEWKK